MKTVLFLCAVVVVVCARPNDQYTNKYDSVNIEDVLGNKRVLMSFVKCGLEKGKCSAEGKELKSHIKEALETYCAKCTETQRSGTRRVIGHLINNEPDSWKQLSAKYDKDGKYATKYETELRTVTAH